MTTWFLDGTFKDRQAPMTRSWWLTEDKAVVLRKGDGRLIYPNLLQPPLVFGLLLLTGDRMQSFVHLSSINQLEELKADTPLTFYLDNIEMTYTVYELEEGLRYGTDGKMPGVRALVDLFGPYDPGPKNQPVNGKGRQHDIMIEKRNMEEKKRMERKIR